MIKAIILGMFVFLFVILKCDKGTDPKPTLPAWLDAKITSFKFESVTNPPRQIVRYTYNNSTVYYTPPICCDQYSVLYSENGDTLCFPDGGISGQGDGRCSDFFQTASDPSLIWKDDRN